MFESFSLADFGKRAGWDIAVREGGWQKPFAIPTAEAVVSRIKDGGGSSVYDLEFAIAKRVAGAPECLGMRQLKWGTVIFPSDETPAAALIRCMAKDLGMSVFPGHCVSVGTIGPWLYRSTLTLNDRQLILTILDEQAEKETPFFASLFHVDATGLEQGQVSKAVNDEIVADAYIVDTT